MRELKEQEGSLLCAIQHSGKAKISDMAKQIGLAPNVGRYTLNRLKEKDIVRGVIPFVNLCKVGFTYYSILFSLERLNKPTREKLIDYLSQLPQVVWFGEYAGEYRYGMTFIACSPAEVSSALEKLSNKFGPIISDKEIVVKLGMTFFPRQYLSSKTKPLEEPFHYRSEASTVLIDETDHIILQKMSTLGKVGSRLLGFQTNTPESTVRLRLENLESFGVIGGYWHLVNPEVLGMLSYTLLIRCRGVQPEITEILNSYCKKHKNVTFLVEALGAWDYEVGVECSSPEELTKLMDEVKDRIGARGAVIQPLQLTKTYKLTTYPLIDCPV